MLFYLDIENLVINGFRMINIEEYENIRVKYI